MRKIFLAAILMVAAVFSAFAQKYGVAVENINDDGVTRSAAVYMSDGSSFVASKRYYGGIQGFGITKEGVWTMISGSLLINGSKAYEFANNNIQNVVMRVVGQTVVVAGVEYRGFNSNGREARMFGYRITNGRRVKVFETDWERKSLKRENFRGYRGAMGEPDPDCNYTDKIYIEGDRYEQGGETSKVFWLYDCDLDPDGNILTTGWGERERTYMNGVRKYYIVNRCARVWKNGKTFLSQYENKPSAAYCINAFPGGNQNILTSGHLRNKACAWGDNVDNAYSADMGPITKEAVAPLGVSGFAPSSFLRIMIIDKSLFYVKHDSGSKKEFVPQRIGGFSEDHEFHDVVFKGEYFFAVAHNTRKNSIEVWRIDKAGRSEMLKDFQVYGTNNRTRLHVTAY